MRPVSLLFLLVVGCAQPGPEPDLVLSIAPTPGPQVDARFLSYTVDSSKVVSKSGTGHYDFTRPRLRRLAEALGPAMLRVGGTLGDTYYYDLSPNPVTEAPPGFERVLTRDIWDGVCDFARALDLELLFTLNAGPGPRDADQNWLPDNARELMVYTVAQDCPVTVWELGNEINGFITAFGLGAFIDGKQYANDILVARALVDDVDPQARLAGPASAYWPLWGEMIAILPDAAALSGSELDLFTWHYYPQQASGCPVASRRAEVETLLVPEHLDEIDRWAEEVEDAAAGTEVWLGETSHAQCGGEPELSNRYVTGFWWLDQLGQVAQRGQRRVLRQALTGGHYSLVRDDDLEPHPDYFTSVLWKRLMGQQVLTPVADEARDMLRAYAHCSPQGGVTFALINLSADEPIIVGFDAPLGATREVYHLTADELLSPTVQLNGVVLQVEPDGTLPPMEPVVHTQAVTLAPRSYGYVRLPEATCPVP